MYIENFFLKPKRVILKLDINVKTYYKVIIKKIIKHEI